MTPMNEKSFMEIGPHVFEKSGRHTDRRGISLQVYRKSVGIIITLTKDAPLKDYVQCLVMISATTRTLKLIFAT